MIILSYNCRGLGSIAKAEEIKDFIRGSGAVFCLLQETKLEVVDEHLCRSIWGGRNFGWHFRSSVGNSGGILTMRNSDIFQIRSAWDMFGAVVINGYGITSGVEYCIYNIYAPCDRGERRLLWDRLQSSLSLDGDVCICMVGDFNSIAKREERVGRRVAVNIREIMEFIDFYEGVDLLDLPIHSRSYTWYKPNGGCRSRIDRVFVNGKWLETWPDTLFKGLKRGLSDHCPIIVDVGKVDWGPKPFRYIKAWKTHPNFGEFVAKRWSEYDVD